MKSALVFLTLLFVLPLSLISQANSQSWRVLMNDPNYSYFDVVRAFESQNKGKDFQKVKGYGKYLMYQQKYQNIVDKNGFYSEFKNRELIKKYKNESLAKSKEGADWKFIGMAQAPISGNGNVIGRVDRVAFHPTDSNLLWAGAPSGGLWMSEDSGINWTIVSDTWENLGVGDIVIDQNSPNNMYVATGDSDSWFFDSYGIQISKDGGKTWKAESTGLEGVAQIYRLILHPNNSNMLFCATEDGLFKSSNSGELWTKMTSIDGRISDVEFNPANPDIMYLTSTTNPGWSVQSDKISEKSRNFDFAFSDLWMVAKHLIR